MHRIALSTSLLMAVTIAAAAGLAAQSAPPPQVQDLALPVAAAPAGSAIVPAQTPIRLQLETHISTRFSQYGDGFAARVMTPVYYQGRQVIPAGSIVSGRVLRSKDERPLRGVSELLLNPDELTMPNGRSYTISAVVIQSDPNNPARVNREGMLREPRGLMRTDIRHVEIGAGAGVLGGVLLAGGQGALIGTGVGAAVAAGIWLVRHRHLALAPGDQLTVRLDRPLRLTRK